MPKPLERRPQRVLESSMNDQPISILVVDDDPDCRLLIREAIAQSKIANEVYEAADGREALDIIFQRGEHQESPRPVLVYLDIEMPGLSGQEVLRQVKSSPAHCDIPVVMMTGLCDERQMEQAARNGANSYTLKPANARQFLETVLESTNYWMTIHQYPEHHIPAECCRR